MALISLRDCQIYQVLAVRLAYMGGIKRAWAEDWMPEKLEEVSFD